MTPRILFVPVSGAGGAGEFMRSLIIARAVRQRWPDANVHFIVNAEAGYAKQLEFPSTVIQGSPTYNVAAVNAVIRRERPHIVVFDSAGRVAQYRCARAVGASVVYVSSRFKTRWKGFRLRRMRYFDQHWIAQPRFLGADLTRWERLKLRLFRRIEVVFLQSLFEPSDPQRCAALLERLQVQRGQFIALCIGSGGRYGSVEEGAALLLRAARRIHAATGLPCVAIVGANAAVDAAASNGVRVLRSLPNGELIDVLSAARAAVVNGGSLLLQTLANGVLSVAVPVAGDQAARIERCAQLGLVAPSALDAAAIESAMLGLLNDAALRARLHAALEKLQLRNDVPTALYAVARLLDRHSG